MTRTIKILLLSVAALFAPLACGPTPQRSQTPSPNNQAQLIESIGMATSGQDARWAPWFRQGKDDVLGAFWYLVGKDGRACIVPGMVAAIVSSRPDVPVGCDDWRIPRPTTFSNGHLS